MQKRNTLKAIIAKTIFKFSSIFYAVGAVLIITFFMVYPFTPKNEDLKNNVQKQLAQTKTSQQVILIVNGEENGDQLPALLKRKGFVLINVVTSPLLEKKENTSDFYLATFLLKNNDVSTLTESLKSFFKKTKYSLHNILPNNYQDSGIADQLRQSFQYPFNDEAFRTFNKDKRKAIQQINTFLNVTLKEQEIKISEFEHVAQKQSFPYCIYVKENDHLLATYVIQKPEDIVHIKNKIGLYNKENLKLWIQPYFSSHYRLQLHRSNTHITLIGLWEEKTRVQEYQAKNDYSVLVNPRECEQITPEKLNKLAQQLTDCIYLKNGVSEFVFSIENGQPIVINYSIGATSSHRNEIMEKQLGYSPLTYWLNDTFNNQSNAFLPEYNHTIMCINLHLNDKSYLRKFTELPTFYKYYEDKSNESSLLTNGELYLAHSNKELIYLSHASIRNIEHLLHNPQFSTHSTTQISQFYRTAALNKNGHPLLEPKVDNEISQEEKREIKKVRHNSEHIPKFIKSLSSQANIQDIMRYYIDVYDLYILHGNPIGKTAIAMNTGNPAFMPFQPIVDALKNSFQNNLLTYARYSFQVPETTFVENIARYCKEEHFLDRHQELNPRNVIIGHGSTNVYYLALKCLIKNKGDIVLVTRPTYGLFIDPVYTADGDIGFVDINAETDWKVQPKVLEETINFYNQKAFNTYIITTFIKAYDHFLKAHKIFDFTQKSLPKLPAITGNTDLKMFDAYIKKLNEYIEAIDSDVVNKEALKFQYTPCVRAFYHMNPHNPTGALYTEKDLLNLSAVIKSYPDIYIIEDLAHWGVFFDDTLVPATFASQKNMFNKTLLFLSLSKAYCVPGLRAGVTIGDEKIITEMQYRLLNSSSSATLPAIIALEAVMKAPKSERDHYLKTNSEEYFYRRNLMSVLVNGIQHTELTFEHKIKIYQLLLESEYKEKKTIDRNLLRAMLTGMPLVRTLTKPKGCFFHLLDISKLIGAKIDANELQTATDVRNVIYSICNVDMVPGEMSGNFFNYSLRMSFSIAPKDIYFACKNIHLFIANHIIKHNPLLVEKWNINNNDYLKVNIQDVIDESILNKALIRLYLSKIVQSLANKQNTTAISHSNQGTLSTNYYTQNIDELNKLMNKLLDESHTTTIHQEIQHFINKNEWLTSYSTDIDHIKELNQKCLI